MFDFEKISGCHCAMVGHTSSCWAVVKHGSLFDERISVRWVVNERWWRGLSVFCHVQPELGTSALTEFDQHTCSFVTGRQIDGYIGSEIRQDSSVSVWCKTIPCSEKMCKAIKNMPPHLKCVATLPCEIWRSETTWTRIMINNTSHRIHYKT